MNRDCTPRTTTRAHRRDITENSAEVSLLDPIACRFTIAQGDHVERVTVRICVEFPDDVRALFEALSWRGGASVISCLTCVGRRYVELVRSVVLAHGCAPGGEEIVVRPSILEIRAMCSTQFSG